MSTEPRELMTVGILENCFPFGLEMSIATILRLGALGVQAPFLSDRFVFTMLGMQKSLGQALSVEINNIP